MADDVIGANGAVYINMDEGLKRMMNNPKFFAKMLGKFKTDNATLLADAIAAVQAGDQEKAKMAIHTLKGIAANLSLTELYKQTLEAEAQIKAGSLSPETQDSIEKCFAETIILVTKVIEQYAG
ncbi:peptidase M52, hydrogen uptake protein [Treponema primitia ZAS-2]|uniref:Peptidase M52, hydrogen uptake protein n=1 Tax=Treponema primitia (strain ATCC BAA-887 / DSM 12427 / ZAS-2) TaxID=545694 RepID=F5YH48_TREPZ|nr:Hpt domain-containing protein [Treponema primitia]AEF86977.1 peptidase M52, hydrogen uptake protein [Treponema primitia ZAS-2]